MLTRLLRPAICALTIASLAPAVTAQSPLNTPFPSTNGLGAGCTVYFDLTVNSPIIVQSLDVNTSATAGTSVTFDIWRTDVGGTRVGNDTNPAVWTTQLATSLTATSAGQDNRTSLDVTDFLLNPGTYGFAIRYTTGGARYKGGITGDPTTIQTYSTAELSLTAGAVRTTATGPFTTGGSFFDPRYWSGSIYYIPGDLSSSGACCFSDGHCDFIIGTDCQTMGGVPRGGGTTCPPTPACAQPGACCFLDGHCQFVLQSACPGLGGNSWISGGTCMPTNSCPQSPTNDACTSPTIVTTATTNLTALNQVSTSDIDPGTCNTGTQGNFGVWYLFTPATSGTVVFNETSTQDIASGLWIVPNPANPTNDCPNLSALPATQTICLSAETWAAKFAPGFSYYLQVGATSTTAPTVPFSADLTWLSTAPANDECTTALDITGSAWPRAIDPNGDNRFATDDAIDTCSTGALTIAPHSIWFRFTPPVNGSFVVNETSTQNIAIAVWSVSTAANPSADCPGFPGAAPTQCVIAETLTQSVVAGTTYYIMLHSELPSPQAPTVGMTGTFNFTPVPANDTCAGAIALSLNTPVDGNLTVANNDYQVTAANPPFSGIGQAAFSILTGRDVVYTFNPATTAAYNVRIQTNGANFGLYIADACPTGTSPISIPNGPGGVLAAANRPTGTGLLGEMIHNITLNAGTTYYIFVDQASATAAGTFTVEVSKTNLEVEPNNTPATASAYLFGDSGVTVSVAAAGDFEFFSLGSPVAGSRVFALTDIASAGSAQDSELRVTTDTDTIEYDDDGADTIYGTSSFASLIAGTPSPGGPLYLKVTERLADAAAEPYLVYAVVQPPSSSAAAEVEPNDSSATATSNALNYYAATMSSTSDADFYSFTATAGEMIFMVVDANPNRNVATAQNLLLDLRSSDGTTVLIAVNDTGTACTNPFTPVSGLVAVTPVSVGDGLVWRARYTGTYYARVTAATVVGTGDYLLSIAKHPEAPSAVSCCRGTTCVSVTSGTCTGTVGNSASLAVGTCGPNNQIAHCCYADYDHSGTSTIDDLFIYINTWLLSSPYTKIDGNTTTAPSIDDLFIFINLWLVGCTP